MLFELPEKRELKDRRSRLPVYRKNNGLREKLVVEESKKLYLKGREKKGSGICSHKKSQERQRSGDEKNSIYRFTKEHQN